MLCEAFKITACHSEGLSHELEPRHLIAYQLLSDACKIKPSVMPMPPSGAHGPPYALKTHRKRNFFGSNLLIEKNPHQILEL
jgi:hypothetical protein